MNYNDCLYFMIIYDIFMMGSGIMKFIGTRKLETERLILRRINNNDYVDAYNNWCNSSNVSKYVLWDKHNNIEETKELYSKWVEDYNDNKTFRWIVELKDNSEVIGTIDVGKKFINYGTCEIGYCYGEKYWNNGYATEVLKEVIRFLFEECEADTIFAEHLVNNIASGKVMENANMKYEGRLRSRVIDNDGIRNDLDVYSITKEGYFNK